VISVRSLWVALALLFASVSVAHAQSNGVPPIDGEWRGKIKGIYYDQTSEGSLQPKQKYKDRVDVVIDQEVGDIDFDITFENGLPSGSGIAVLTAELDGTVGNYHLSIAQTVESPAIVGSGKINKKGNVIVIRGIAASDDYTHEFWIKLKKTGN
jgi:hypothetical protein